MDNRIVIEPSSKIREIARRSLEGNWKQVFVGAFIYFIMLSGISSILGYFFTTVRYIQLATGHYLPVEINYASGVYEFLVSGPLMCGLMMFLLTYFRTKKIDYRLNFEGFSMFGKAFVLFLLYSVKIFLWSLLFGIPGIIAAYRYSQCFYLRVEHPDWTATECINESKRLMRGNKAKLFCLQLSFIGWYFLAGFAVGIITYFEVPGILGVIILIIGSIPTVIVDLYCNTALTAFYEIVTGNLVVVNPELIYNAEYNYNYNSGAQANQQETQQETQADDRQEEAKAEPTEPEKPAEPEEPAEPESADTSENTEDSDE